MVRKKRDFYCTTENLYKKVWRHVGDILKTILYIDAGTEVSKSISSRATKIPPAKKAQLLTRFLWKD